MSSSWRRTRSSNGLFAGVFDIVVFSFPQDEPREPARLDSRGENLPERDHDVLGRRNHALHEGDVEIEVLVVDVIDHLALDDLLELGEIADISRPGIDIAFDRDV